jgi:hypothetical protein
MWAAPRELVRAKTLNFADKHINQKTKLAILDTSSKAFDDAIEWMLKIENKKN